MAKVCFIFHTTQILIPYTLNNLSPSLRPMNPHPCSFHCWHNENCARCGNSFRVFNDHHDNWESTQSVIEFLAQHRQPFWGPDPDYGWPDADFVYTGGQGCGSHSAPGTRCQGQTDVEYVSEYSIWAIAQGQIVVATV